MKACRAYGRFDRMAFERYVEEAHKADALLPLRKREGEEYDDVFHASLISARTYMGRCFTTSDRQGRPFRVYPGFVQKEDANAFAWVAGATHVCGIHTGLVVALFELFLFCFTQRRLFREIGNADAELSPPPIQGHAPGLWILRSDARSDCERFAADSRALVPMGSSRYACAFYTAHLALRFVWFHELYHCLNGHVGYSSAQGLAMCLNENADLNDGTRGSRLLRCLEFDADQSALWASCKIQINGTENILGIRPLAQPLRLKLLLFGVYCAMWLFEEIGRGRSRRVSGSHPRPYARLHNMIRCLAVDISPMLPGLDEINSQVLRELDVLAEIVPSMFVGRRVLDDMRNEKLYGNITNYGRDLDALRKKFIVHSYA